MSFLEFMMVNVNISLTQLTPARMYFLVFSFLSQADLWGLGGLCQTPLNQVNVSGASCPEALSTFFLQCNRRISADAFSLGGLSNYYL